MGIFHKFIFARNLLFRVNAKFTKSRDNLACKGCVRVRERETVGMLNVNDDEVLMETCAILCPNFPIQTFECVIR